MNPELLNRYTELETKLVFPSKIIAALRAQLPLKPEDVKEISSKFREEKLFYLFRSYLRTTTHSKANPKSIRMIRELEKKKAKVIAEILYLSRKDSSFKLYLPVKGLFLRLRSKLSRYLF